GNSQYASHGRPTWISGKMPAQQTAKMVIASAKRLIELRQDCLKSRRMAEISVPAWPIPIHQTKLMIAKPHAPGMVTPQMPTPLRNSQVSATMRKVAMPPATARPPNQPMGVFEVSTMPAIFCVTLLKLCPGAMTAYSPVRGSIIGSTTGSTPGSCMGDLVAILCQLRVGVDDAGRIGRARAVVQVRQHLVVALGRLALRYLDVGVVQIAEDDRVRRAGLLAGGDDLAVLDRAVFLVRRDLGLLDALHAVRALLHDATRADRDIRVAHELEALGVEVRVEQEVEPSHLVHAVVLAVARADAAVVNHHVQPLGRMHCRAYRANLFAACVLALLAHHGLEVRTRGMQIAFEVGVDADPLHVAVDLHLRAPNHGNVVLRVAAHDTGVTADAGVEIDRDAPLVLELPA